ncbi:MAG TPA: thiamine pyrophosphate-dependent enzyme [Casimicrobiaceae bacterium]|jgi:2-oxoisovalerate dehydrogenase E1 component|nr:thiamine pyrophosphate-dependent enzyme [Casimicrobiaceae bacterium]
MANLTPLTSHTKWVRLEITTTDWKEESPALLVRMLEQILLIRRFEEKLLALKDENLLHGPAHASIGQEGGAVGCMSVLRRQDKINGTHRMHHQFIAKVLNTVTPDDYDPRSHEPTKQMQDMVTRTMAEILGLKTGFCGGRGGSMHLRYPPAGVLGSNAIVGGNLPHAVGYALADKRLGSDGISVAFFGDGAMQMGTTYESMNLAALYNLPVIFFVENNFYAVSTHLREQTREVRLTARGQGLAVPSIEVDGMDTLAVRKATQWAFETIRNKYGPVLIEAQTYRYLHQSGRQRGSAFGYRDKREEEQWMLRDPVAQFPRKLIDLGILAESRVTQIDAHVRKLIDTAADAMIEADSGTGKRRVISALWPDSATVEEGIRGDLSEFKEARMMELENYPASALREVRFIDCIAKVMLHNMEKFDRIIVLGEDVHRLRGGTAGATKGIDQRFPDRLIGTPICENGFVGMALGAALNGMRPVVEIMYPDFCLVAADQLFNQVAKVRHMFGGGFAVPIVVRSRVSAGTGYGSQHSMDASALFALYPGWRIVMPSTPFDYIGLMNSAILCDDPVLVVEHNDLYQTTGMIPDGDLDYYIPFGSASIARPGSACTVLTYLSMVRVCQKAAEESGIDAEIIDLRSVDPLGLDWATIEASVRKTNRVIVVEQTARGTSHGARLAQEIQERCFDWLDHEILRVTGTNSSPVVSRVLEQAALAGLDQVVVGLRRLAA